MVTDSKNDDASETLGLPLAARAIRKLLWSMGYAKHKQAKFIVETTGLSYPQANRKLQGASGWDIDEFELLCRHLGRSIVDVLDAAMEPPHSVLATLIKGSERLPCTVQLGEPIVDKSTTDYVAGQRNGAWHVGTRAEVGEVGLRQALRIVLQPLESALPVRVAVLDDDRDACDSLCELLEASGFNATPFYALNALVSALPDQIFDAFVLDWVVPGGTVLPGLMRIREVNEHAPIAILTGKLDSGEADAHGIAGALGAYRADYFSKPSPVAIIAAALKRGIARHRNNAGDLPESNLR